MAIIAVRMNIKQTNTIGDKYVLSHISIRYLIPKISIYILIVNMAYDKYQSTLCLEL